MIVRLLFLLAAIGALASFLRPYVVGRCPDCGCFKASRADCYCRECGKRLND